MPLVDSILPFQQQFSIPNTGGSNAMSNPGSSSFSSVLFAGAILVVFSLPTLGVLEQQSDFDAALKAADANVKSTAGMLYDAAFAMKAVPWLASAMYTCPKGLPNRDLKPLTVLVRVDTAGKTEQVLIRPLTKVARCLKPLFASAVHPKPPGPSWWVKMDISINGYQH